VGKVRLVNPVPLKAFCSMLTTPLGIVNPAKDVHPSNADSLIVSRPDGTVTVVNALHPLNAAIGITLNVVLKRRVAMGLAITLLDVEAGAGAGAGAGAAAVFL
jgi:hypothetical protein